MIAVHAPLTVSTTAPAGNVLDIARLRSAVAAAMNGGAIDWMRQTLCGLSGHSMMLHFESTRLSLQCASCGRTTPGWAIEAATQKARCARD
jgi:hypothetical protein